MKKERLLASLKVWFVIHFVFDVSFAIPMLIFPNQLMPLLGWQVIDPVATRLVAAALFGIGIESLLGRSSSLQAFKAMLNLKIIWSLTAVIGIVWSLLEGAQDRPWGLWMVFCVFFGFHFIWLFFRLAVSKVTD